MQFRKEGYFSIGEISKIMGLNPKSILYYEKLGILSPAKTDRKNNYRYYSPSQLGLLSAIKICIQLGIPLRDFSKYRQQDTIHASRLLEDAASVIRRKMQQLQKELEFIGRVQKYIDLSNQLLHAARVKDLEFPEMRFAAAEISPGISYPELFRVLEQIGKKASEKGYQPGLLFGKIACYHSSCPTKLYAVLQVSPNAAGDNLLVLPAGKYACLATPDSQINQAPEIFPESFSRSEDLIVFESILVSDFFHTGETGYMLRCAPQK